MSKQNQEMVILNLLLKGQSITSMGAFRLGITRLASRIHELRVKNYPITDRFVTKNKKSFKEYFMNESYNPL